MKLLTLERVPLRPELRLDPRITELTRMRIDGPRPINLSQFPLHGREPPTHLGRLPIRQDLDRSLIDRSCGRQTEVGCSFRDVDREHLEFVRVLDGRGGPIVDPHGAFGETMLLFQLGVHQVQRFAELGGAVLEGLFEEVTGSLQLLPAISSDKFREIDVPDFKGDREVEQLDAAFIDL